MMWLFGGAPSSLPPAGSSSHTHSREAKRRSSSSSKVSSAMLGSAAAPPALALPSTRHGCSARRLSERRGLGALSPCGHSMPSRRCRERSSWPSSTARASEMHSSASSST